MIFMGNIVYPHRIRLRGPWECEPLGANGGSAVPAKRAQLPARWRDLGLAEFKGLVRLKRRFGYPGQIDSWERVWLAFAGFDGSADITLNEELLGRREGGCSFEVTRLLRPRNLLQVDIDCRSPDGGLWGEVALEVRCTAFLEDVRARREGQSVRVAGKVTGKADGLLEIYVLGGRKTLGYATVEPDNAFELTTEETGETASALRIELVSASTVWHALDVVVGE